MFLFISSIKNKNSELYQINYILEERENQPNIQYISTIITELKKGEKTWMVISK